MSLPRMTPEQLRRAKALIKKTCCNYDDGHCLVLGCPCPQMHSYSLLCKWFRSAVLPQDTELYSMIMAPRNTAQCTVCGSLFEKKANNAKYCNSCRISVRRKKVAQYKRKCVHKGNHSEGYKTHCHAKVLL